MLRGSIRTPVCVAAACWALVLAVWWSPAWAQDPKYEVNGFRDAKFGMTEAEVRAIAIKAFGIKDADLATAPNPVEGTTVLTARVRALDPGPGIARVSYIFGFKSKKLVQVNVIWGEEPPPSDVSLVTAASTRLLQYFQGFVWRKDSARMNYPLGDNTVVVFSGEDEKKGAVRLILDGIKYQTVRDGNAASSPEPKGPPKLFINYIADREDPDIAKIERGKF